MLNLRGIQFSDDKEYKNVSWGCTRNGINCVPITKCNKTSVVGCTQKSAKSQHLVKNQEIQSLFKNVSRLIKIVFNGQILFTYKMRGVHILFKKLAFLKIIEFRKIKDVIKRILFMKIVLHFQKNNVLKINYAFFNGIAYEFCYYQIIQQVNYCNLQLVKVTIYQMDNVLQSRILNQIKLLFVNYKIIFVKNPSLIILVQHLMIAFKNPVIDILGILIKIFSCNLTSINDSEPNQDNENIQKKTRDFSFIN